MPIYTNTKGQLNQVKEKTFKLEREIQSLFEENLGTVMGLELIKSEFSIKNKRIDTLAYDSQTNAFIIIEYKKDKNVSVVDQGFTYLSLMLENKADFIVEYNESLKRQLKRNDVDWSQTRVVFVSTSFTENQKLATNFKDIAIELWEVKRFDNNTVSIAPIRKSKSAESIKPITEQNKKLKAVQEEIKVYTEEEHLIKPTDKIRELYETLRDRICQLTSDIDIVPQKMYIAFRKDKRNFVYVHLQQKNIKIWLNAKWDEVDDPKEVSNNVALKGHYGYGEYEIDMKDDSQLEYILSLIKETFTIYKLK
jgi:predicted transport protein